MSTSGVSVDPKKVETVMSWERLKSIFEWNDSCEKAFQELKRRLTSALILIVPKRGQRYTMYCDAFNDGIRCVLI